MYFTIPEGRPSSPIGSDALLALQDLSHHAEALGNLTASFTTEAQLATETYAVALAGGYHEDWTAFVAAADSLVRHAESVDSLLHLSRRERAAYEYFVQIVRENEDLLGEGATAH